MSPESAAMREGGDACIKKTAGMSGGVCVPFSLASALGSIARVPIPESSLCFFLWHQRKKRMIKSDQDETQPLFSTSCFWFLRFLH
jgi:hypothetical protein